jgi:hypothetical protein
MPLRWERLELPKSQLASIASLAVGRLLPVYHNERVAEGMSQMSPKTDARRRCCLLEDRMAWPAALALE